MIKRSGNGKGRIDKYRRMRPSFTFMCSPTSNLIEE